MRLIAGFIFQGSSGRGYTYHLFPLPVDVDRLPLQAANYLFAIGTGTIPAPIWIECGDSLRIAIQNHMTSKHWGTATDVYGIRFLCANFDSSENPQAREAQKIDLIDRYAPPVNRDDDKSPTLP
jgi:hypothetical protein